VEAINCIQADAVAHDDAFVASIVRLQAAVPENSAAFVTQACPADIVLKAAWEAYTGVGGAFYSYATLIPDTTALPIEFTAPRSTFIATNCAGFYPCASASTSLTAPSFFFNISARPTQSANVRVSTPSYTIGVTPTFIQWGNETYLRVADHTGLRDECSAPVLGILDTSVRHNIPTGSWAVVAVSWMSANCKKCTPNNDIRMRIEYMGASSSALSNAVVSIPLMMVAAIVAFVAQRF